MLEHSKNKNNFAERRWRRGPIKCVDVVDYGCCAVALFHPYLRLFDKNHGSLTLTRTCSEGQAIIFSHFFVAGGATAMLAKTKPEASGFAWLSASHLQATEATPLIG